MNNIEKEVLKTIIENPALSQRKIADLSGHSLGIVNRCIRNLCAEGYLDSRKNPTSQAEKLYADSIPDNAIILAAGFGMRMVPVNRSAPKGLMQVHGEPLIERTIRQLKEAGVEKISVVVGFMMEQFDYLVDEYGVDLVINTEYISKNNLYSLSLAADRIGNTYIVPCDVWCSDNPFSGHEMHSWYMLGDTPSTESSVRQTRNGGIALTGTNATGNRMIGIAYIDKNDAETVRDQLLFLAVDQLYDGEFWESALFKNERMIIPARIVSSEKVIEINTYEQLRELDNNSNHLRSEAIDVIANVFDISPEDIKDIRVLKKGMTNRSFLFSVAGEKYIMRIPGEGTDLLINRRQEAEVYEVISGKGLCDDPVYINPENGYKITKYLDNIRTADPENDDDLHKCMRKLRQFHEMGLKVEHSFDLFEKITLYESLWDGQPSAYRDYQATKEKIWSLKPFVETRKSEWSLTHIDAVCDNFLFYERDGSEELQLTDWEYSGMQDPYVDIAMFCIYSYYSQEQIDHLIDIYFDDQCDKLTRALIYSYIAICGLLWSDWTEYKYTLGVEFGDYGLRQYRYAKDYYRLATELLKEEGMYNEQ